MIKAIKLDFFKQLLSRFSNLKTNKLDKSEIQIAQLVKSHKNHHLLKEIKKIFSYWYDPQSFKTINNHFKDILHLFNGKFKGYQKCNTHYHDLNHTKDIFLACIRLIDGYNLENSKMPQDLAINLLSAALFHDIGYIQEINDKQGTGAKYTQFHVQRSVDFIEKHAEQFNLNRENLEIIQKLIQSTGLSVNMDNLQFKNSLETTAGYMLGTADLLGQMADRNYLEKLLFLYYEFKEAGIEGYHTEFDIIKQTLNFYKLVTTRFEKEFQNIYKLAENHFKNRYNISRNLYIDAIEKHIDYINRIIDDGSTNFRKKLNRMHWNSKTIFA